MDTRELYGIEDARFILGGISRAAIYKLSLIPLVRHARDARDPCTAAR
jgi:hypothetical protein